MIYNTLVLAQRVNTGRRPVVQMYVEIFLSFRRASHILRRKTRMKKFLAMLLALVMALSLVACGE